MEKIEVSLAGGRLRSFRWRGRRYPVRTILERWKDTGRWWEGEGTKVFLRAGGEGGALWEICFDPADSAWYLYKVYD